MSKVSKKTTKPTKTKNTWLTTVEASALAKGGYFDSEGALHNIEGCVRCTSTVISIGKRCKNFALPGELCCHIHGGTLARKKIGKERVYSAFLQDDTLKAVYERSLEDNAEVRGVVEELSLLRTLLGSVVKKRDLDTPKTLKEVAKIIGEIRQLVKDCTTAEIRLGQLIDIGKVVIIVAQLAKIVSKYVTNEEILKKIAHEFDDVIWPAPFASTPQPSKRVPVREVQRIPAEIRK